MLDFYKKVFEDLKNKKITKEQAAERLKAKANLAGEDEDFRAYSKELVSQRRSEKEVINLPQPEYTFAGKGPRENKPNIELTSLIGSESKSNSNACCYSLSGVQNILTETLSQSLYMDANEIHIDRKFIDLGLDSIIGVEWIEKLKKSLPLNIKVTKIYDFPTIRDLASNLHSELLLAESALEVTPEKLISSSNDLTVSAQSLLENEEQSLSKELIHHTNSDVRKEQRKYVATILSNTLAKALFMDVNEITPKKTFTDLGLDSIIGVEWVNTVNKNFHVNIKVTTIYDYPNVEALSGYIDGMLLSRTMGLPGAREDESPEILSAPERIDGERANSRDDRPASNNITERELASVSTSVSIEFNKAYHLGAEGFRQRYGCSMSYFSGSMYRAIASEELVLSMANAEILSFFGSAGFKSQELNQKILSLKLKLQNKKTYGMCLIHQMDDPDEELKHVNLFIEHQIPVIEVAAFFNLTPALVYCRVKGLKEINGKIIFPRRIIAKCSRIEVATLFMSPPSEDMLVDLLAFGMITEEEARLAAKIPMADDLAIECDSGGHTDHGIAQALIPSIVALRDTLVYQYVYQDCIYIGCGGGLGTPQAIASAFILGADFVFTGSINQCTVESGASDTVKDILTRLTVHDTTMAPAGDMFEIGAKVQVVNKYSQFAKRANHLYRLYQQYASLDDIPHQIRKDIEKYYFNRSIDDVWKLVCEYKKHHKNEQLDDAKGNPKLKMKLVFQWYYAYTNSITANGDQAQRDNFQIHCGPAMGAFNLWVRGTELEVWQNRRVVDIAHMLMSEAGVYLASSKEKYSSSISRELYSNDIAIIGMAGQFPCSNNLQEFWLNLVSGNDCIREVPADRWNLELFYSQNRGAEGKSYCRWLGVIDSAPNFDPLFFQISPVEARLMDPQQRVFLQNAWHCFEDAGINPDDLAGTQCGVYVGCVNNDYGITASSDGLNAQGLMGGASSILSARISYLLDLKGPCLSIDTACSSSLVAIAESCNNLKLGTISIALAGGVCVLPGPTMHIMTSKAGMLSEEGRCFTFDHRANGFVPAEGVGVVLLKRLSDARQDGDRVQAIIKGWGINQDGKTNGITAPSVKSQYELEKSIYEQFAIDPATISMVEAHGTGTQLGDPIEIEALKASFSKFTQKQGYCALASLKSNFGHMQTASGVAGVIKVVLSLQHKKIPPSVNFEKLNPHLELEESPFFVNSSLRDWPVISGMPRRAAVSSFGFSGTNAHLIIEEGDSVADVEKRYAKSPDYLLPISAVDVNRLKALAEALLLFVNSYPEEVTSVFLERLCYTQQIGRKALEKRLLLWFSSVAELKEKLNLVIQTDLVGGSHTNNGIYSNLHPIVNMDVETLQNAYPCSVAWLHGERVDWGVLYGKQKPNRLVAPLYPFYQERYWIDSGASGYSKSTRFAQLTPMLHRNTSNFLNYRFTSHFDGSEFFLRDHVVLGRKTMPAVATLEIASNAIMQMMDVQAHSPAMIFTDVIWHLPIIVDQPSDLHIQLFPEGNGLVSYKLTTEKDNFDSVLHSSGKVFFDQEVKIDHYNVEELINRDDWVVYTQDSIYGRYQTLGINYGPAFKAINRIFKRQQQLLVELILPEVIANTKDDFFLHPSLFDAALQAALMLELRGTEEVTLLPYAIEELQICANIKPIKWAILCFADDASGLNSFPKINVELLDENGRIQLRLKGLLCRAVPSNKMNTSVAVTDTLYLKPVYRISNETNHERKKITSKRVIFACDIALYKEDLSFNTPFELINLESHIEYPQTHYFEFLCQKIFSYLKDAMLTKKREPHFIQVIAPIGHEHYLYSGLLGLLATVQLENPLFVTQLIEVPVTLSRQGLAEILQVESCTNSEKHIRYDLTGGRYVYEFEKCEFPRYVSSPWRENGVYLITGGMGGLGQIFAQEISMQVKKAVIIVAGRSAPNDSVDKIRDKISCNTIFEYHTIDISNQKETNKLVADIVERFGQLNGVIHAAGIVKNNFIINKTDSEFSSILLPKVSGTAALDFATKALNLDFFALFSSGAGVIGNLGQADYAAANAYMDSYSWWRHEKVKQGLRYGQCVSINWPLWQSDGMGVSVEVEAQMKARIGMTPMLPENGIQAFYKCLSSKLPQVLVVEGDIEQLDSFYRNYGKNHNSNFSLSADDQQKTNEGLVDISYFEEKVTEYLSNVLSESLNIPLHRIDKNHMLEKYGIDSILAMKLTEELEKTFGPLSKTLFFEYQTITELSAYFVSYHREKVCQKFDFSIKQSEVLDIDAEKVFSQSKKLSVLNNTVSRLTDKKGAALDIAIIGLSGKYPESPNLAVFWDNLCAGKNCIREIPPERWDWNTYYSADQEQVGGHFSKWGGFIADVDKFDPKFFNLSGREATYMDPQERLFLEHAWAAVEDAGYTVDDLAGKDADNYGNMIGVYAGVMYNEYQLFGAEETLRGHPTSSGGSYASIANRVSFVMNLHGPSMTVDTMCSSSLSTIHLACQDLAKGIVNAAIAGGVNLSIHPGKYRMLSSGRFISSKGSCESFGEGGDGYIPGEGVGVVVLKRLAEAIRDGDDIYGVVKGSALSHGGKTNGYSVPNPRAQAIAIRRAIDESGVNSASISYVEAHGTGTRLGDPIEINGLTKAFGAGFETPFCYLGSVKSNIGHCESAAGIAGLTKVLLQMKYKKIVPSLHSQKLNPNIDFDQTPFVVNQSLQDWCRPIVAGKEFPRIAGVSAFGAGGSNAHLIIEEFTKPIDNNSHSTIEIMVPLSARTMNRLVEYAERFVEFLERTPQESLNLVALAYTLQVGREHFDTRVGFIVRSVNELIDQLRSFIRGEDSKDCYLGSAKEGKQLVELFSNDVEMERILASWFLSSRYTKIIDCWVKGISINWHNLYTHSIPGRIHLPTYPFARESYWVETQVEQSAVTDTSGQFQQSGNKKSYGPLQKPVNIALIDPNIFSGTEYKSDDHFIAAELNDSQQLVSEDVKFVFSQQVDTVRVTSQDTRSLLKDIEQQLVSSLAKALFLMHEDIELDKPFIDMGLDSIVAVEWIRDINSHYKTAIAATMFYEYPTINDFSKFIANELQKKSNVIANIDDEIRQENTIQPEHTPPVNAVEAHVPTLNQQFDVLYEALHDEEASLSIGVRNEIEEPIAIIGMAGRYPGADNLGQYWENLLLGKSSIHEVPKARWDIETHYDPRPGIAGKVYSKWLGALEDIDCFDAEFFRISSSEADEMDPQHRLFLQEGFRAFEDAAYSAEKLSSTRCGIYMGIMSSEYSSLLINNNAQIGSINNSYAIAAARLSYYLNLKGPAIPIDTACSSSLVATHLACQALRNKEIDMALAGGVSLYLTLGSYIGMCSARMLSTGSSCRAFDDRADGFVPGEGVGAVVLKRLIDAERDGDRIHAKIIASGINHDGRTNGLSAPNGASQRELLKGIYQRYAIDPASISYIEAHGTGTRLGDAIELEALSHVLKTDGRALNSCAVGSVKTNLGHTSAASGMSSLHKVVLSIKNSMFVPTIGVEQSNSFFRMEDSPLYVVTDCKPWTKATALKRAGVNAFGFSGTNAHVVVEEYISGTERLLSKQDINFYLIPLSATNHESLVRNAHDFYVALQTNQLKNQPLMDIAYTLQTGREAFKVRVAFVVNSVGQLEDELATFLKLGGVSYPNYHDEIEKKEYSGQMEFNRHFGSEQLVKEIASDWISGKKINWLSLYDGLHPLIISLPGYCFQKTPHWVEAHRPQVAPNVYVGELSSHHESATVVDKDFHLAISYLTELVGKYIGVNPKDIVIEKNFIELGVKSVGILKIAQQLRLDIDNALQPTLMYEYSNIMALARFLAEQYSDRLSSLASADMNSKSADRIISSLDDFPELIHLNSEYGGTPIFWIHGGMGGVQPYFEIAKYIRRPFFGIQAVGYQTDKAPIEGISAIAACYINIIKQVQPNGPYELGGYSLGGLISYEMTRQLQEGGEIVKTLVMLDTIAPFPHEGEMSKKTAMLQAANMLIATSSYHEQCQKLIHRDELHVELTDDDFAKRLVSLMALRGIITETDQLRKAVEKSALVQKSYQFENAKIIALKNSEEPECYYLRNKSGLFWGDNKPYYYFDDYNLELDGRNYWSPWEKAIAKFTIIDVDSSNHMQILTDEASKKQVIDICQEIYGL